MASIDNIANGKTITWSDFTNSCIEALKNVCCNIGTSYASGVPSQIKNGAGKTHVHQIVTSVGAGGSPVTHNWYANPSNLITLVPVNTVNNEWTAFLSAAGISARSNKIIQAKELGLALGLFQQYLAYHVKRVYTRIGAYNTNAITSGSAGTAYNCVAYGAYQGNKYVSGTCTPKYKLTAIEPSNIPTVTNGEITNLINQAIYWPGNNYGMLNSTGNPSVFRSYLSIS